MADVEISVVARALSDNSLVYDVHLGDVRLPAITRKDAEQLAEAISDAIGKHTNEIPLVDFLY